MKNVDIASRGDASAQPIDHLKKPDMAREAERLLAGTGWEPEPLRTPDAQAAEVEAKSSAEDPPAFLSDGEDNPAGDQRPPIPRSRMPSLANDRHVRGV